MKDIEEIVINHKKEWIKKGWSQSKINTHESAVRSLYGKKRPDVSERNNKLIKEGKFNLYKTGNRFKKGIVAWNKGTKGLCVAWNKGKYMSEESKKKMSASAKLAFKEGRAIPWQKGLTAETSEKVKNLAENIERRKKISKTLKNKYKDPEYKKMAVEKSFKEFYKMIFPNKSEKKIIDLLNNNFPNDWKYVGDASLFIGGKNPDFVSNNNKFIIEFNGVRWHKPEDEKKRIDFFNNFGYKTLVIWEPELKRPEKIIEKVRDYFYGDELIWLNMK